MTFYNRNRKCFKLKLLTLGGAIGWVVGSWCRQDRAGSWGESPVGQGTECVGAGGALGAPACVINNSTDSRCSALSAFPRKEGSESRCELEWQNYRDKAVAAQPHTHAHTHSLWSLSPTWQRAFCHRLVLLHFSAHTHSGSHTQTPCVSTTGKECK